MLTVEDISIRYDQQDVVKDCSFHINEGEILSIIGPNGSGKSTLLKAISGFIPYHKGSVRLGQQELKALNKKQIAQMMCMLSQKNQVPQDMTVEELISYGRFPHKKWYEKLNAKDQEIIEWAIDKTHLQTYRHRTITTLSGGEAQRVWIAMALTQRPKILLLDEPTTYLDIAHQHEILTLVHELNKTMKMTVVMVLHDLNQASQYSDRILVIQKGRLKMCGSAHEVMTEHMIRDVYRMDAEIQSRTKEEKPRIHLICPCKEFLQKDRRIENVQKN